MHTTWTLFNMALRIFFFLSRRTDYKHNYLVQCQIRSQILVIRLCDYRHLKNKVCRSVKHTCWWGHYLGVRYNLNHQKFLSVCSRFVTFQNSFFFSSYFSSFIQVWVQNILSMSQPSVPGASCSDLVTSIMAASGTYVAQNDPCILVNYFSASQCKSKHMIAGSLAWTITASLPYPNLPHPFIPIEIPPPPHSNLVFKN